MKISRIQIIGNLVGLIPGGYLIIKILTGNLSADPIRTATIITGRTSVYAILFSLYCTPLALIFKLSFFHALRKISGLFAFYYALVHFLIFAVYDYQLNFAWIIPELKQKTFLQIGLIALVFLIPLAATSFSKIQHKLGKWWKRIHKLVYIITAIILLHITVASKGDIVDPAILFLIYIFAMAIRLPRLRLLKIRTLPGWLTKVNDYLTKKYNAS